MSLSRRIAFAVLAGWLNRFVGIALSFIFIRVLFRRLGEEEQGFWLLLGNSAAFLSLFDLGVSATLTRRIALARGKSDTSPDATITNATLVEILELIATGKWLYRFIALLVFLFSLGLGFVFLAQLKYQHISLQTVWLAWAILCLGYAINVWGQVWQCLLNGIGLVGWNTIVDMCVNLLMLVVQIALVLNGGGILQMAIVAAASGLVSRQLNILITKRKHPEFFAGQGKWSRLLFKSMVSPSLRAWLTSVGAFLILKTDQYFITYFLDASELPKYNAAYQIVSNMYVFAISIALGSSVYISHMWQAGDIAGVHVHVKRSVRLGMIMMVCGAACIAVAGQPLIDLWLGPGHFVGYWVLWTFLVMLTLEVHHVIVATASRATEDEAFAFSAILSGILNLVFTYVLIKLLAPRGQGLLGVAMGTMLAQLLTNNWYAVYRGLRRLKMSVREHVRDVILPTMGIFLIALVLGYAGVQLASPLKSNLLTVIGALVPTSGVLVVAVWYRGLSNAQRGRVVGFLFRAKPVRGE